MKVGMSTWKGLFGLVVVSFLTGQAFAQSPPLNCPGSGWYERELYISSKRFQLDERSDVQDEKYAPNLDYSWQVWFNTNVTDVRFVFEKGSNPNLQLDIDGKPGFHTEPQWDSLTISGAGATAVLSGDLDQNHTVEYISPSMPTIYTPGSGGTYVTMRWVSDYSIQEQGFAIKKVRYHCGRINSPAAASALTTRIHKNNNERVGTSLGTNDMQYFSAVQPANLYLIIHLRSDSPREPYGPVYPTSYDHTDYDLYASASSTTPGPSSYTWRSNMGRFLDGGYYRMLEDFVIIPPVGTTRNIYFSVLHYSGATGTGGFKVYDNAVTRRYPLRVGTDFNDRADPANWAKLLNGMRGAAGGLYEATDGTAWLYSIDFWHNSSNCGGLGCQLLFHSPSFSCLGNNSAALCTSIGCANSGYRIEDCRWHSWPQQLEGTTLGHEFGHCFYNSAHEYPDYVCGHSIMTTSTSAEWRHVRDFCTGTNLTGNHGMDHNAAGPPPFANGLWTSLEGCYPDQTLFYKPGVNMGGTQIATPKTADPEDFGSSAIWQSPSLLQITERN